MTFKASPATRELIVAKIGKRFEEWLAAHPIRNFDRNDGTQYLDVMDAWLREQLRTGAIVQDGAFFFEARHEGA